MSDPMFPADEVQAALNAVVEDAAMNGPGIPSHGESQHIMAAAGHLCHLRGGTLTENALATLALVRGPDRGEPKGIFG